MKNMKGMKHRNGNSTDLMAARRKGSLRLLPHNQSPLPFFMLSMLFPLRPSQVRPTNGALTRTPPVDWRAYRKRASSEHR